MFLEISVNTTSLFLSQRYAFFLKQKLFIKKRNMAIVYEHLRNDTNEVFYVGIGAEKKRAYKKSGRTPYWKNIVEKVGYTVDIIHSDVDWDEACELEKHLILLFGRKDLGTGNLVNLTDGGEGNVGIIFSNNHKEKISEAKKGKTHSEETKKKISEVRKGKTFLEETKKKISEAHKGKTLSEETKQRMSQSKKNMSDETKQKMSKAHKGMTLSEETKQKISAVHKGKKLSPESIAKRTATREANKGKTTS
jgi:hypothetical protein